MCLKLFATEPLKDPPQKPWFARNTLWEPMLYAIDSEAADISRLSLGGREEFKCKLTKSGEVDTAFLCNPGNVFKPIVECPILTN